MKLITSACRFLSSLGLVLFLVGSCAAPPPRLNPAPVSGQAIDPVAVYQTVDAVKLGEPLGVTVDLHGNIFIADGLPGQLVQIGADRTVAREFQPPPRNPSFLPSDIKLQGFFIYTIDQVGRTLLRYDKDGAYRDLLISFKETVAGRRVYPYGLGVDSPGRMAITDVENHQILIYDIYLTLEKAFGNYGSYPGQLDSPEGVSFTGNGDLLVADTGNKRVQLFGNGGDFIKTIPAADEPNPMVQPRRAVMAGDGRIYIADPGAGRLFVFDGTGFRQSFYPRGVEEFRPTDVEVTGAGLLYVTDAASRALYIFKVVSD
jgi:DNA-binding beta-propeller fold protein YncE